MRYKAIRPIVLVLVLLFAAITASSTPAVLSEQQQITHVLNRMGFGARPGDVERVQKMGVRAYVELQLSPDSINDARAEERVRHLTSLGMGPSEVFSNYPDPQRIAQQLGIRNPNQGDNAAANRAKIQEYMASNMLKRPQQLLEELVSNKVLRAVYSERQLQEVMTDFWFNHFNVYWNKGADQWLTTAYENDAIRPNVLGKFKDLVLATAKSPAMLFYLDNHLSSVPAPQTSARQRPAANRRAGINENYARELMELHTMGVDGGYTQKDVTEVARAFTGWTIDQPRVNGSFMFRPMMHDNGEKTVLGHKIRANGGISDGEQVIDVLVNHPSTARFISTKLVRRFVADDPPESLVTKVAATYTKTDGDIREMLRTIFLSDEFMSSEAFASKTKTPFEYVVSAVRALNGDTLANNPQLVRSIAQMGQPLYQFQAPTGFPDRADYWMSNGALVARLNFAVALTTNRIPDTRVSLDGFKDAQAAALFLGSPDFQKR